MSTVNRVNGNYTIIAINPTDQITLDASVVESTGLLQLPLFTTTQRNALSASNGQIIYNTTTNTFQGYANGSWVNLN